MSEQFTLEELVKDFPEDHPAAVELKRLRDAEIQCNRLYSAALGLRLSPEFLEKTRNEFEMVKVDALLEIANILRVMEER